MQAVESGRYFFTDDVIVPNFEANADVLQDQQQDDPHAAAAAAPLPDPHGAPDIYLPERDEQSRPSGAGMAPSRRLRQKTAPAMLHRLSMETIEGERQGNAEMDGNSLQIVLKILDGYLFHPQKETVMKAAGRWKPCNLLRTQHRGHRRRRISVVGMWRGRLRAGAVAQAQPPQIAKKVS